MMTREHHERPRDGLRLSAPGESSGHRACDSWVGRAAACVVLTSLLLGCSDDNTSDSADAGDATEADTAQAPDAEADTAAPEPTGPVITSDRWEVVTDDSEDPFSELRPDGAECDPEGYQVEMLAEEEVFSIDTWSCNYVTLRQTTLRDLRAGDVVEGRIWHFDLTAPSPGGDAYVAYHLGGEVLWEESVRIPSSSGLVLPTWTMAADAPAGTPLYFHLNNHGSNSWSVIDLVVAP